MSRFQHKTQVAHPIPRKRALPLGMILNSAGKPVNALIAPAGGTNPWNRMERVNAWREHLNPLRGLTISRAIQLLEDYQLGRMADVQWTFFFTEMTDPDMIALLALRVGRIVEMDYNLSPEEDADKKLVEEQIDALTEKLASIDNLYEAIEHLAMAPFRGYAHVEKHVNSAGDVFHLEPVDQWNVIRDGLRGPWKYNPTALSTDYVSLAGEDLPLDRFLYRETRRPINRFALLKFVRGGLSEKDWDAFNEIYNVPGGVVIGPPEVPEGDETIYEEAARKVAEGGTGYLPHGSQYVPNEMPHDPQTFKQRLDYLSEKLVLAGTGGKLTMLTESGSGTLAGGAHAEVFDRIASAEAKRISEIISKSLIAPWLDAAFPGQEHVVYFGLAANEETNSASAVEQVAQLSAAGFQLDPEQVTQKTGWRVTLKPKPDVVLEDAADEESEAAIKNRASAAANEARFEAASQRRLAEADREALKPLIDRVAPIRAEAARLADLEDEAAFAAGWRNLQAQLAQLQADLPAIEAQCLGDAASEHLDAAFSDILGTAMAAGIESGAESRNNAKRGLKNRQRVSRPRQGRQNAS